MTYVLSGHCIARLSHNIKLSNKPFEVVMEFVVCLRGKNTNVGYIRNTSLRIIFEPNRKEVMGRRVFSIEFILFVLF
jgi:hypothetical protein